MSKKIQSQKSNKRTVFQARLFTETPIDEGSLPAEIHVIPTGEWDHPLWGEIKIDASTISEFAENFNKGIRKEKVPITAGHTVMEELPAIGWFTQVFDRGDAGLYASVEWTEKGKQLLLEGSYKYFSPEYYTVYEDPATHKKYKNVLVGGALTNHPFFKELDDVVSFSEPQFIHQFSNEIMNIAEILAKAAEERSEEEVAFLEENKDELSDEQTAQLEAESGASEEEEGDDTASDEEESAEEEEVVTATEPKGKLVTMSAAEAQALREKANQGAQAFSQLQEMKVKDAVSKMTFSATNPEGHFKPNQVDSVVKFMSSLSDKQRDQFTNIVNNMPKAELFSELGTGEGDDANGVEKELDTAVTKVMADDKGLSYADAVKQVFSVNPDLEKRYNEKYDAN